MRCPKCGGYNFDREDRCLNCGYSVPSQKAPAWWGGTDFQGPDKAPDHNEKEQEKHNDVEVDRPAVSLPEFHSCPHCKTLSLFWNQHTLMYECLNPDCGKRFSATEYESNRGETTAPQNRDKPDEISESIDKEQVRECPACKQASLYWNNSSGLYECLNVTCKLRLIRSEFEQLTERQQPHEEEVPIKEKSSEILETCPSCGQGMLRWNPAIGKYECLYWKCRRTITKEYFDSAKGSEAKRGFRLPRLSRVSKISIGFLMLAVLGFALFYGLTHVGKSGTSAEQLTSTTPPPTPVHISIVTPIPIHTVPPIPTLIPLLTPVPLAKPTPTPNPALILFKDDFSNNYSGWDTYSLQQGSAFYYDGWLHIKANPNTDNTEASYYQGQRFGDFVLDIDTKLVSGSNDNWHIIVCRDNGLGDNYLFALSTDGYYYISKWFNGLQTVITSPTASIYIQKGVGVTNHITIECIGSNLRLSVNGHLLSSLTDSAFTDGLIALCAYARASLYTEVAYDNIVVRAP